MLRNNVAATLTYFYPIGNTPATCLTQNLPPEQDADILLLGCGDARNILFTTYAQQRPRRMDITCCDIEPAILARNILLFSILLDNGYETNLDRIWNIYYHWKIDKASDALLKSKTVKLCKLSQSMGVWQTSQLGQNFRFCDGNTLYQVRDVWKHWLQSPDCTAGEEDFKFNVEHYQQVRDRYLGKEGIGMSLGLARAAAPLSMEIPKDSLSLRMVYWKDGGTFEDDKTRDKSTLMNRTFFATGKRRATLHYGTDPLLGFHLATAFASLTPGSPLRYEGDGGLDGVLQAAKTEFKAWVESFRDAVSFGLVVRLVTGDALALGHTLQMVGEMPGQVSANLKVHSSTFHNLELDSGDYTAIHPAPTSFDVIDNSNLADHLGPLNVIVASAPLLKQGIQSTLYTEMLVQHEASVKERNDDLLCGNFATMSFLLGLTVVESWTDATLASDVDEALYLPFLKSSNASSNSRAGQQVTRQCWKQLRNLSAPKPFIAADTLCSLLVRVFRKMFKHDDALSAFANLNLRSLQKSSNPYYTRSGFAAVLKMVQQNIDSDWKSVLESFINDCQGGTMLSMNMNYMQELFVSLCLHKVYAAEILRVPPELVNPPSAGCRLRHWNSLPQLVCVTIQVPRRKLSFLTALPLHQRGAPSFYLSLESSRLGWCDRYGAVQSGYGQITNSTDETCCFVEEDTDGIHGKSDLLVSAFVATWQLFKDGGDYSVGVGIQNTALTCATYAPLLGLNMRIFDTDLRDTVRVRISALQPQHASGSTLTSSSSDSLTSAPALGNVGNFMPVFCSRNRPQDAMEFLGVDSLSLSAELDPNSDDITSMTAKLALNGQHQDALAVRSTPVETTTKSPFEATIVIGDLPGLAAQFPKSVSGQDLRCRIARKSSWIEVIAVTTSLQQQLVGPTMMLPISAEPDNVVSWSAPYLNLDTLPQLDITRTGKLAWLNPHISMMLSDQERAIRDANLHLPGFSTGDLRTDFKESLHSIFNIAAGTQGPRNSLFGLNKPGDGGNHVLIMVSSFKIDQASRTVILDAAAVPLTDENVQDPLMQKFFRSTLVNGIRETKVSSEELVLWRHVLPTLAERCRAWEHDAKTCEYMRARRVPPLDRIADGTTPFCSCGQGKFPDRYGVEVKLKHVDAVIRKYGTRVAISPVFAVPYVEDCFGMLGRPSATASTGQAPQTASSTAGPQCPVN